MMLKYVAVLIFTIFLPAQALAYSVQFTSNLSYGTETLQKLDLCRPIGAPGLRPALIMFHGGGWAQGDKNQGVTATACKRYAGQGYVVFNVNYRLVLSTGAPYPNTAATNVFPTGLSDAQLAIRWARSKAASYFVDSARIGLVGFSAGANLAALAATLKTTYPGDMAGKIPEFPSGVAFFSGHSTPADLTLSVTGPLNADGHVPEMNFVNVNPMIENIAVYREASPQFHVASDSAPMSLTQGNQDNVVLPQEASTMIAALNTAGVPNQLLSYTGGHVFQGALAIRWQLIDQSVAWGLANASWP